MRSALLFLTSLLVLGGPAGAQTPTPAGAVQLQPGDVIRVEIWREEDLSGEFLVDEKGEVVLPLLGTVRVTDQPIPTLRDSLLAAYRSDLHNPSIVITPLRRIYILGEVMEPGLLNVDPTISLAGAIALAGGANPQGNLSRIRLVRSDGTVREGIRVDAPIAREDIRSGDQIFIGRRDWFDRNSTFVVSALLSITSIVVSLTR